MSAAPVDETIEQHLEECESCRRKIFSERSRVREIQLTSLCEEYEESLIEVAAGLAAEDKLKQVRAHTENCAICTARVQALQRDFGEVPTKAELAGIRTAVGPRWAVGLETRNGRRLLGTWSLISRPAVVVCSFAALAIVVGALLVSVRWRSPRRTDTGRLRRVLVSG